MTSFYFICLLFFIFWLNNLISLVPIALLFNSSRFILCLFYSTVGLFVISHVIFYLNDILFIFYRFNYSFIYPLGPYLSLYFRFILSSVYPVAAIFVFFFLLILFLYTWAHVGTSFFRKKEVHKKEIRAEEISISIFISKCPF